MATTAFSAQWGIDVGETNQTLAAADGWKTFVPYQVWVDTDTIDGGSGVLTIPATGIYHLFGNFSHVNVGGTSGPCICRWLGNGTDVLASGVNPNSSGTDEGVPIAQFTGCLEAGTTLEFQAFNQNVTATHTYGGVSVLRVPSPFTILEMDGTYAPAYDAFEEFAPICDIPAWWDAGQPTRVTVPTTGYYLLAHKNQGSGAVTVNTWRDAQLFVNGSFVNIEVAYPGEGTNYPMNVVLSLTAGDYVEIFNDAQPTATNPLGSIDLMMFEVPGTFCGAQVYKASQVVNGTFANVTFNTSIYDTNGFWAGGSSPYLSVPSGKAGKYLVWSTDMKPGKRNVRSYLFTTGSGGAPEQDVVTGVDNYGLDNLASSPHMVIWDLAVGDQVYLQVINFDTGGTAVNFNMGMMLIDGWSYTSQVGCPCPSGVITSFDFVRLRG